MQALKSQLLTMGGLVENRIHRAVDSLIHRKEAEAQKVIDSDVEINDLQIEIDERCLKILATQTPVAVDLRFIAAAMKINSDLERMGDQAVNIAENTMKCLTQPPLKPFIDLPRMAALAQEMTRDSLDAFVRRDAILARDVLRRDDTVDDSQGPGLPRAPHIHDGRPGNHRARALAHPHQPEPGAGRRPRDQHR